MSRVQHRNLGQMNYMHGLTHWAYQGGAHTAPDLMQAGYWNDARDMLAPGDWIFVSGQHYALQLYVMQVTPRVVVSLVSAAGALGDLPAPDYPDDYLAAAD